MAKFKAYNYRQRVFLPVSLEDQLMPGTLEFAIHTGYARGLISSRKIEQACRENVVFIALACGQQPDHSTIPDSVSAREAAIQQGGISQQKGRVTVGNRKAD